jgi:hypothetical protein
MTATGPSWFWSEVLLLGALITDALDGKAARKFGSTKAGPYLDDIADFINFGLHPATLDMDSHGQYGPLCTLYLCDFLSSRTIHNPKTRHERLFPRPSFTCVSSRSFLNPHCPTNTIYSHARDRDDSISHYISYPLYARDENRMGKEKYVYSPRRMLGAPLDLWW